VGCKTSYFAGTAAILCFSAQAASFTVLSGGGYQPVVAPNSWAVAFGTAIAQSKATATLTADGQWPTTLAGITVQVDGLPAELYYVSPGQINFLVPDGTDFGSLSVVITDVASGATQTSSVLVANTAASIFSSDGSGAGPGAILNGVTYAGPPFLVETAQNGASDLRTRLAVYCTGLRYAGNPAHDPAVNNVAAYVTAQGKDAAGNQYSFPVEYAGPAPGYFGLDQANIVLPAELDAAGAVSLTLDAEGTASNVVTFLMNSLPAASIRLVALTLSSAETTGGSNLTGTLSLNGLARTGGTLVSLRSNISTMQLPSAATVAPGQASASFTISTATTFSVQYATITAQGTRGTLQTALQIDPTTQAGLNSLAVTPSTVQGGTSVNGTVGLSGTAPLSQVRVLLASDDAVVAPPAFATVQVNNQTASFTIATSAVTAVHTVNLTATLGNNTATQQVTVVPPLELVPANDSVTGGTSVIATLTLGKAAPASGAVVAVSSSAGSIAQTPATVTIASGQTTATFTITTFAVTAARTVTLRATYGAAAPALAMVTVNPRTTAQLQSLAVFAAQVTGGTSATGTVTLSAPAQGNGQLVLLKTDNPLVASVPYAVTVAPGSATANFTVLTSKVASFQLVTITATAGPVTQTATLSVD
jgi:uncharacterized protein (TIGR03437 family)